MSTPLLPGLDRIVSDDHRHLLGSECRSCGALRFPSATICASCQSRDVEDVPLPTRGQIYTYSVVHAPPPGYLGDVPYAVGIVELPNGLRITTTLLAESMDEFAVGRATEFETIQLGPPEQRVTSWAYRLQ